MNISKILLIAIICFGSKAVQAQAFLAGQDTSRRVINTAVPFMTFAPDARSGALGDAGVATSPDANSTHWNVGKLALVDKDYGFALSYTPWLSKIVNDMWISYLTGFYKINKEQTVGLSLRYFDLGDIQFTDDQGGIIQDFNPREVSISGSYSRLLSDNMSLGVSLKYIHSNLSGNISSTSTQESQPGNSVAADIGWYWNGDLALLNANSNLAIGASITNIGSKLTYSNEDQEQFIPTTFRLGAALTTELDPYNKFTFMLDMNKLMVPSPPIYETDEDGNIVTDSQGDPVISKGKDPNRGLISGMFGSFGDAPDGFSEEIKEIMWSMAVEYWYDDLFSARLGYFNEHADKGNRKYFTAGLGFRYNVFGIDFAYLVPQQQNHPLAETIRFTLLFNFDKGEPQESITDQN